MVYHLIECSYYVQILYIQRYVIWVYKNALHIRLDVDLFNSKSFGQNPLFVQNSVRFIKNGNGQSDFNNGVYF